LPLRSSKELSVFLPQLKKANMAQQKNDEKINENSKDPGFEPQPGLPDFSWHNIPKRGNIYHFATKLPIGHNIYLMAVKFSK
jgi:hypothetical protein